MFENLIYTNINLAFYHFHPRKNYHLLWPVFPCYRTNKNISYVLPGRVSLLRFLSILSQNGQLVKYSDNLYLNITQEIY